MFAATMRLNAKNGLVNVGLPALAFDMQGMAIDIYGMPSVFEGYINQIMKHPGAEAQGSGWRLSWAVWCSSCWRTSSTR